MTPEHDDELARELYATRAEPRPEFARELDRRAAGWLGGSRRGMRMPSLRIAIPAAAAAAALVIALAVGGGGDGSGGSSAGGAGSLELTVSADESGAALGAAPKLDTTGAGIGSVVYSLEARRVHEGDPIVVSYDVVGSSRARALLAGRRGEVTLPSGRGQLSISTDGIEAGRHRLRLTIGTASPKVENLEILPGG